jgi:hypothetical protein
VVIAQADVAAKIKFWAPGGPQIVNGISVELYADEQTGALPTAFLFVEEEAILSALEALYAGSPTARALLDTGSSSDK